MRLMILWGQRKEAYPEQYAPEPVVCWGEYEVDENPEGFEEACEEYKKARHSEFVAFRVIPLAVDLNKVQEILVGEAPTLEGKVES